MNYKEPTKVLDSAIFLSKGEGGGPPGTNVEFSDAEL